MDRIHCLFFIERMGSVLSHKIAGNMQLEILVSPLDSMHS